MQLTRGHKRFGGINPVNVIEERMIQVRWHQAIAETVQQLLFRIGLTEEEAPMRVNTDSPQVRKEQPQIAPDRIRLADNLDRRAEVFQTTLKRLVNGRITDQHELVTA